MKTHIKYKNTVLKAVKNTLQKLFRTETAYLEHKE